MIKTLPSMEHTFTIDVLGSETKQRYTGTFTYKRPNLKLKSEIAKMTARLNEDLKSLDSDMAFIHQVLATLRYTLQAGDNAEWWIKNDYGYALFDVNVILDIYKECQKFEDKWFNEVWAEPEKAEEKKKPKEK